MAMSAIVLGAGIAGIGAARHMARRGVEVTILEARDRIGGRLHTCHDFGPPIDLGGSWIHGVHKNPLHKLARKFDIPLQPTPFTSLALTDRGDELEPDLFDQALELSEEVYTWAADLCEDRRRRDPDRGVGEAIWDDMDEATRRRAEEEGILAWALYDMGLNEGWEARGISLARFEDDDPYEGGDLFLVDGYQPLVEALADGLRVELNTQATELHWGDDGVRAHCQGGASFEADVAVITLPLGVLKAGSLRFEPALPPAKQRAIEQMGAGLLSKLVLRFARPFWPRDAYWIGDLEQPFSYDNVMLSMMPWTDEPILVGFLAGAAAEQAETRGEQAVVEEVMGRLRARYDHVDAPLQSLLTTWSRDPFSRGAYCYYPVGAPAGLIEQLARPVDERLYFAGEACEEDNYATAHGAYISGRRVGKTIGWLNQNT